MSPADVHRHVCESFDEFERQRFEGRGPQNWDLLRADLVVWVRQLDAAIAFAGLMSVLESERRYAYQDIAGEMLTKADIPCPLALSEFMRRVLPLMDLSARTVPRYAAHVFGRDVVLDFVREVRSGKPAWSGRGTLDAVQYWLGEHPGMATLSPQIPPLHEAVRPSSVQPGGGFCMNLELAWGRCRRAFLRCCRPGYVEQMRQQRQGDCPNCPHDIIDARDLKYYRNVCGFWFRAEDDRFRWRDRLGFARAGLMELIFFSALFGLPGLAFVALALTVHWLFWIPAVPLLLAWLEVLWFFRDPERPIPSDPAALVSPADGTITHVHEVDEPDFPGGKALRLSIFLSVFNVHVNRTPRTARVIDVRYFPGCFLDARAADCAVRNEQLWIDMEDTATGQPLRVKQISGAIARRIVCWLKPEDELAAGQRIGMIKFGSRTDILVPLGAAELIAVKVGDKVKGGSSILLHWKATI